MVKNKIITYLVSLLVAVVLFIFVEDETRYQSMLLIVIYVNVISMSYDEFYERDEYDLNKIVESMHEGQKVTICIERKNDVVEMNKEK